MGKSFMSVAGSFGDVMVERPVEGAYATVYVEKDYLDKAGINDDYAVRKPQHRLTVEFALDGGIVSIDRWAGGENLYPHDEKLKAVVDDMRERLFSQYLTSEEQR